MTLPTLILPTWLYHSQQGGKIFRTEEDVAEAKAAGWRDSPAAAAAVVAAKPPQVPGVRTKKPTEAKTAQA